MDMFCNALRYWIVPTLCLSLVACGTDTPPPEGGTDQSSSDQIAGSLPPGLEPQDNFVVATVGDLSSLLDNSEPSTEPAFAAFSSALAADGSFSIDLSAPDPNLLITEDDFCGDGDTLIFAATGALFVSDSADLASTDDIRDVLRLGSAPGNDTNYNVIWFYSDRDFTYVGNCGADIFYVNLTLTEGWNTVALSVENPLVGNVVVASNPVPEDARWYTTISD